MSALYVETSAVVAWLLGEPASPKVRKAVNGAQEVLTSVLTIIETKRIFVRAELQGSLKEADAQKILGIFNRTIASWVTLEITPTIRERAAEKFPREPLRTLDAIHLATALEFTSLYPNLSVLSFDDRILKNLEPLGLPTTKP